MTLSFESVKNEFENYFKKFDTKNENILRKYHHSIRVMNFSIEIAKSLNLSEDMIKVIGTAGLLHDIGRFEQWKKYETYSDLESIDHAKLGVDVLTQNNYIDKYISDETYKNLVLKAIYEHNKYKMSDNLTSDEELICKIIRDADKLDIVETQGRTLNSYENFHKEVAENIYKKQLCVNNPSENEADRIVKKICFIYDINFKYSLEYIKDKNILNNKLKLLKDNVPEGVNLLEIEKILNEYLNNKIKKLS